MEKNPFIVLILAQIGGLKNKQKVEYGDRQHRNSRINGKMKKLNVMTTIRRATSRGTLENWRI